MDCCCGSDLLDAFHNLGINTGNVKKQTIDAWFDTDCEATQEMLLWMCKHLGKENVLTAHENEEYEQSLEDKTLLAGKQYNLAVSQMEVDYPGILDYELNLLEIDCMEDELEMLRDKQSNLEHLLDFEGNLEKKLSKEIKRANEKEILSMIKNESGQEKCLELSRELDQVQEKLQQQIDRYAIQIEEFEYVARPTFVSNIPTMKYDQYYSDITSYLELLIRRECQVLPKLKSTAGTVSKKLGNSSCATVGEVDKLEILRERIFKSIRYYFHNKIKEEKLQAEVNFLQGLNINEFILTPPLDDSALFLREAKTFSHEEMCKFLFQNLEDVIQKFCNGVVDTPKIALTENTISINRNKLECLTKLDCKVTEILAKHILLLLILEKEKNDLQSTDKFFRDVLYYIRRNLHDCHFRTETMTEIINEHGLYESLSLEQKFKLADVIKSLLVDEQKSEILAVDAVRNFQNDLYNLEQQVFFGDYVNHRQFVQEIETEIDVLRKFLISGPTTQIITIPSELSNLFNKIKELEETQEASLKTAMQLVKLSEKQLTDNKWFRVKRHLWMWFLFEPKRVLRAIEQIEAAVKEKRNEA